MVGIVNTLKVCTKINQTEILTKGVSMVTLGSLSDESYGFDWGKKKTKLPWLDSRWLFPRLYYHLVGRASLRVSQYSSVDLHIALVVRVFRFF